LRIGAKEDVMGEVRREVRREVELDAPPADVWEALVDDRLLSEWLADEVELDPVPGGPARFRDGDDEREGMVLEVDEERRLSFTWSRPGEAPSEVELIVDAVADRTRLVVVERALVGATSLSASAWSSRLQAAASTLALIAA
jgi:uncharacterized protein YndB with AHSA1/START domain